MENERGYGIKWLRGCCCLFHYWLKYNMHVKSFKINIIRDLLEMEVVGKTLHRKCAMSCRGTYCWHKKTENNSNFN